LRFEPVKIDLPQIVQGIIQTLTKAGYLTYLVGGCVRDHLLGRPCKDYDIVTSARPEQVIQVFKNSIIVGKAYGVVKLIFPGSDLNLEIATFRKDLNYKNYRHPEIEFSSPQEDALRRDFTINNLYYDLQQKRVLDFTESLKDLRKKTLRAIGNPGQRFQEDALRLLRAIRFKTQLGFQIETQTAQAIEKKAELILKISAQRVREELTQIWQGPRPHEALLELSKLQLLNQLLPELDCLRQKPEIWEWIFKSLENLARSFPERSVVLSWSTVLFALESLEKPVKPILERLQISRLNTGGIVKMIQDRFQFCHVFQMKKSSFQKWINQDDFGDLLKLYWVSESHSAEKMKIYDYCFTQYQQREKLRKQASEKLISGKDLIQLGFIPSPIFKKMLQQVEDLVFEESIGSKEEALQYVLNHFKYLKKF